MKIILLFLLSFEVYAIGPNYPEVEYPNPYSNLQTVFVCEPGGACSYEIASKGTKDNPYNPEDEGTCWNCDYDKK